MGSLIERARRRWKEKRRAVGVRPFQSVLCESLLLAAACAGLWHIPVWAKPVVATAGQSRTGTRAMAGRSRKRVRSGGLCDLDMDWRYLEPGRVVSWEWSMDSEESQKLLDELGGKLRTMKLSLELYIDNRGFAGGDVECIDISDDILLDF